MVYCPSVVFLSIFVGEQGFDAGDKVNLYGDPQSPGLGKPCHHDAFGDFNKFAKIKDKLSFQLRLTIYLHLVHQNQFYFQTDLSDSCCPYYTFNRLSFENSIIKFLFYPYPTGTPIKWSAIFW